MKSREHVPIFYAEVVLCVEIYHKRNSSLKVLELQGNFFDRNAKKKTLWMEKEGNAQKIFYYWCIVVTVICNFEFFFLISFLLIVSFG